MAGEDLFRSDRLPWIGLFGSTIASALMLYGATKLIARQEF
jgi:hypothetical protein